MILIRGIPGSGKSTIAKQFNSSRNHVHIETDMFWFLETGEYKWDASRLSEAHAWCLVETKKLLEKSIIPVVSNTFTTVKELKPYFDLARQFSITPNVILAQGGFKNIHNVPEATLKRMKDRFVYDISELFEVKTE